MTIYNIRDKFNYTFPIPSIEYIRNYNFNTSVVTDLPLSMSNSDDSIPITVDITTTVPWMSVINPTTGTTVKFPNGNVVIQPTSSVAVVVKIDLPPEIESSNSSSIRPNIILDIKSGSFPIITPSSTNQNTGQNNNPKSTIITEATTYTINVGERVDVNITVYDNQGIPNRNAIVNWLSNNMSIVQVESQQNNQTNYNPYTPRTIKAISPGETTVTVTAQDINEPLVIRFIVRQPLSDNQSSQANESNTQN